MAERLSWSTALAVWLVFGVVGICFNMMRRSKRDMAVMRGAFKTLDPLVATLVFLSFVVVAAMGPAGFGVAFVGWLGRGRR